jgi:hypothetical protein
MPSSFMKSRRCVSSAPADIVGTAIGSAGVGIHGNRCFALIA